MVVNLGHGGIHPLLGTRMVLVVHGTDDVGCTSTASAPETPYDTRRLVLNQSPLERHSGTSNDWCLSGAPMDIVRPRRLIKQPVHSREGMDTIQVPNRLSP